METKSTVKRYKRDETADPTNPNPSIVVHVRNLNPKATEADLLEALSHFGPIAYATCIASKRMALVEFEELECARKCVVFAQTTPINVAGYPALFNYSTSQAIQRIGLESEIPNHILVLTIYNAHYTINVDVIHQICSPHGQVLRIAMIKRTMVQALVEFESIEIAKKTKHAINGADIYSGCCTLKVEFAKVDHVKVVRNDQDQWDYTTKAEVRRALIVDGPPGNSGARREPPRSSYTKEPTTLGAYINNYDDYSYNNRSGFAPPSRSSPSSYAPSYERKSDRGGGYQGRYSSNFSNSRGQNLDSAHLYDSYTSDFRGNSHESSVVMIYGINHENFNCSKIFNLLCGYGNVKFMHKKQDTCMAEMDNPKAVANVMKFLHDILLFKCTLSFRPSKQNTLHDIHEPFDMPDNTASFVDFSRSRNNRFSTLEMASKNRLAYPSAQLHWFNAPASMNEEKLRKIFSDKDMHSPKSVTVFNTRSERSATGLVEFLNAEEAGEVLMTCNHVPINEVSGKPPYILKLAFSDV